MSRLARWRNAATLAFAGSAHALTFAPDPLPQWSLPIVQILAPAVLARASFAAERGRQAFLRGWAFGFVNFAVGLYWLFISIHDYGGLSAPLAGASVVALSAFLALFPALACAISKWLQSRTRRGAALSQVLVWSAVWAASEWLRGVLFSGFPWLNIGYAHVDSPLVGWAPLLGVHGVALLAACASGTVAFLSRPAAASMRSNVSLLATVLILIATGWTLTRLDWSTAEGEPLHLRLVQGNIDQSQKFDPTLLEDGIASHLRLAAQPPGPGEPHPDLIVLPETVVPVFQDQLDPMIWKTWLDVAANQRSTIAMGVPLHSMAADGSSRYTNSAIGFDSGTPLQQLVDASVPLRYDKHHLVPWGEYVPAGFEWFTRMLKMPLGDFDRGAPVQRPFSVNDQHLAFNICYEDVFGSELLPSLLPTPGAGPGASVLVNLSNLAWFGQTWALRQHLQIGRLRSIETARPMVTSTNTGITASIDPKGRVVAALPPHRPGVLSATVQGMSGLTPYVRYGDQPVLLLVGIVLAALVRRPTPR
ncbi:UNVERIFIED_CONTAM: apolipoprotein N-acyltransferase [Pseudomonas aeruginosa]